MTVEKLVYIAENYNKEDWETLRNKTGMPITSIQTTVSRLRKHGVNIPRRKKVKARTTFMEAVQYIKERQARRIPVQSV